MKLTEFLFLGLGNVQSIGDRTNFCSYAASWLQRQTSASVITYNHPKKKKKEKGIINVAFFQRRLHVRSKAARRSFSSTAAVAIEGDDDADTAADARACRLEDMRGSPLVEDGAGGCCC